MLILRDRGDLHVICICVTEIQVSENLIDEPLEYLCSISEPKVYIRELKEPKGHDDGCFCNVVWMNWNLIVCFLQICYGEDSPASKLLCKVGSVLNGILVGVGRSVQSTIVATGSPAIFFLGDKVEG